MYRLVAIAFAATLLLGGPAMSQGNGNGNGNGHKNQSQTGSSSSTTALTVSLITSFERSTILGYVQGHPSGQFAGLKPLPPGILKLIFSGSLPPGIAKQYFPSALTGQLPPRPGQQWMVMGTDVLLVETATQLILDVLHL